MNTLIKWSLFLMFTLGVKIAEAQSVSTALGARAGGMGNASATLRDEWSLLNNVGGLCKADQLTTSFAYDVRPGMTGANRTAALLSIPLKSSAIGFGLFRFGDDLYNEQLISLGFSNQFGIASLGFKLNYVQYRSEAFGVRNAISINFGGVAEITSRILVGAYIININQPRLSNIDNERLPTKLVAGISFKPIVRLLIAAEIEKDLDYDPTLKGGMEYQVHKKVYFRSGINLHPNAGFLGIGLLARKIKVDYVLEYTTLLGAAHQASVVYRFEKNQKGHGK